MNKLFLFYVLFPIMKLMQFKTPVLNTTARIGCLVGLVLLTALPLVAKADAQVNRVEDLIRITIRTSGDDVPDCGKTGFVNKKGEMVIPPRFSYCYNGYESHNGYETFGGQDFTANGLSAVTEDGKNFGYINTQGEMVIPAKFQMAGDFTPNGLALVEENGKFGYINAQGKMVIPAKYYCADYFAPNGLAFVGDETGGHFINAQGEVMFRTGWKTCPLLDISFSANGLAGIAAERIIEKEYAYVNINERMINNSFYFWPGVFANNGLAAVAKYSKVFGDVRHYGYINTKGETVIPVRFTHALIFAANGLAAVTENGKKWGYINAKGETVIAAKFDSASTFSANGLAAVETSNGKWGYINSKGEMVIQPSFSFAHDFSSNGVAKAVKNGKFVHIDESGRVIVSYGSINGRNVVKNSRGKVIWSENVNKAKQVWVANKNTDTGSNGFHNLQKGDKCIYLNESKKSLYTVYNYTSVNQSEYTSYRLRCDREGESVGEVLVRDKANFDIKYVDVRGRTVRGPQ